MRSKVGRWRLRRRILEVVEATGYASNPHARALRSGQSTIAADVGRLGRRAGEMLLARLNGMPLDRPVELIELDLVRRGST